MKLRFGLRGALWGLFDGAARGAISPTAVDARGVGTTAIISGTDNVPDCRQP
jgi:hypothetical protein